MLKSRETTSFENIQKKNCLFHLVCVMLKIEQNLSTSCVFYNLVYVIHILRYIFVYQKSLKLAFKIHKGYFVVHKLALNASNKAFYNFFLKISLIFVHIIIINFASI